MWRVVVVVVVPEKEKWEVRLVVVVVVIFTRCTTRVTAAAAAAAVEEELQTLAIEHTELERLQRAAAAGREALHHQNDVTGAADVHFFASHRCPLLPMLYICFCCTSAPAVHRRLCKIWL